jgi:hypothetical protein
MVKKGIMNAVAEGASSVSESVISGVMSRVKLELDVFMAHFKVQVRDMQSAIMRRLAGGIFIFVGVCFLIIAAVYALRDYLQISPALTFFLLGLILIIGSILYVRK